MPVKKAMPEVQVFKSLVENSNDIVLVFNSKYEQVYSNKKAKSALKKLFYDTSTPLDKMLFIDKGKSISELIKPGERKLYLFNKKKNKMFASTGNCIHTKDTAFKYLLTLKPTAGAFVLEEDQLGKGSDYRLKKILENVEMIIYSVRIDEHDNKNLEFISSNVNEIFGLNYKEYKEKMLNGSILDHFHQDDFPNIIKANNNVFKKKKPSEVIYRFKNPKLNKYIWVEEKAYPVLDAKGRLVETFGISRNVTERIESDQALVNSEKLYRNIVEKNLAGFYRIDLNNNIVEANDAFAHIYGFKNKTQIIGKKVSFLYKRSTDQGDFVKKLQEKGKLINHESAVILKSGIKKHILENVSLYKKESTNETYIEGTVFDISSFKEAQEALKTSEERYKELFEKNLAGVFRTTLSGKMLDCNQSFLNMFGYSSKENLLKQSSFSLYFSKRERDTYVRLLKKKTALFNHELRLRKKNGEEIWVLANVTISYDPKTREGFIQGTLIDNTQQKRSKENFRNLIEYSPDGNLIIHKHKIIYANPSAVKILGYKNTREILNMNISGFFTHQSLQEMNKLFSLVEEKKGHTRFYEYKIKKPKGIITDVGIQLTPIQYESLSCINIIMYDLELKKQLAQEQLRAQLAEETNKVLEREIEEHKITQQKLREQAAKNKSIFDNAVNIMMYTVDKNFMVTSFNKSFEEISKKYFGIDVKKDKAFFTRVDKYSTADENTDFVYKTINDAFKGKSGQLEGPLFSISGEKVWFETFINPIILENNKISEISCMSVEITERKHRSHMLKQSLKEKEVLLKEVHHRVKNNLQIISSILNLQSSFSQDEKVNEILRESQNRVKSMSYIHESLYQNKNFSSINFSEYILNLSKNLVHSYHYQNDAVDLKVEVGEIYLGLDQAIPCGLILNELLTNSLKYAFTNRKPGEIRVTVNDMNEKVELAVEDNGVGLPKGFEISKTNTLGLQLVSTLVEQLDGNMLIKSGNGVKYSIIFTKQLIA